MLGIAHREQGKNVSGTQTLPDGLRVISAVTQDAVRPTTGGGLASPAMAVSHRQVKESAASRYDWRRSAE
jgi:hypothetical protein